MCKSEHFWRKIAEKCEIMQKKLARIETFYYFCTLFLKNYTQIGSFVVRSRRAFAS